MAKPSTSPTPKTTRSAPSISRSAHGDHGRGHWQPGSRHSAAGLVGAGQDNAALQSLGRDPACRRQGDLYRHGRHPPDLEARPSSSETVSVFAGSGIENITGWHCGIGQLRPAQRPGDRRRKPLRRRLRGLGRAGDHGHSRTREPAVRTIVGQGLFEFGDKDGRGATVRLQHCLGLAYAGGHLYIADTYNNKIKICEPRNRSVRSLVGAHKAGRQR